MIEGRVAALVTQLADELLSNDVGIHKATFDILHTLVDEVLGPEAADRMSSMTDATDGYYYYPVGNLEEGVDLYDDLAD